MDYLVIRDLHMCDNKNKLADYADKNIEIFFNESYNYFLRLSDFYISTID